ncbi:LacI family DNA-binding transcriptional regulator, partial [Streptomyces sp. NPDC057596]|uniref:LacI family DNA-binding transcriptional regulator n=1 Tax=Streptomyces sp. NPDC057596 TaxID=3346178 RepID=UPI0036B5F41A
RPAAGGAPSPTSPPPPGGGGGPPRPPAPRVRLVDVAREAGLSKTTVSAALNGTGRLSPAVREHARETARRLGYRPNATARLLRAGHARLIGYAVGEHPTTPGSYMDSPYFAQLTSAVATAALHHGYALVLLPTSSSPSEWADLPLDAAIIADPLADDPLVEDFIAARVPLSTDRSVEGRPGTHWVDIDTGTAVREVLDHLHAQGAQRIAVVAPDVPTRFYREALDVYRHWCAERKATPRITRSERPGNGPVVEAVERALTSSAAPDALFVLAEANPPLVLDAARRLGLSVPGDLLLVCASEDSSAAYADPPITTLSLQPHLIAATGVAQLIAALESGSQEPTGTVVPAKLELRASSQRGRGPRGAAGPR